VPAKKPRGKSRAANSEPAAPAQDSGSVIENYPVYSALSLMDLLRARDLYHRHLMNKAGVLATAIGKYLIRKDDSWPHDRKKVKGSYPRTLENSQVRPYSWPCLLVFVEKWLPLSDFAKRGHHNNHVSDLVPQRLYLPDGTLVPVCVVEASSEEVHPPKLNNPPIFPRQFLGGGYPLIAESQGAEQFATVGCLVTDGHTCYALTNRHVTGPSGEHIHTVIGGESRLIGTSTNKQISRRLFEEVYPGWPGHQSYLHMDIGLVKLEDKTTWRPDIYNVGELKNAVDLSSDHFTLDLIGSDVRAHGAASGDMFGTVCALFYRYKAMGGFEYVCDFLIGPREDIPFQTHPGDSGAVWVLDHPMENDPRNDLDRMPLAVQWGGHLYAGDDGAQIQSYAMGTCLSTVLNQLDLDLIRNWEYELPEYWGAVGHYTIANVACQNVGDPDLRALMIANLGNITFKLDLIADKNMKGLASKTKKQFVPLADVPDLAWQAGLYPRGTRAANPESPNHFADMDEPPPDGGKSLLDECRGPRGTVNSVAVDPVFWLKHYELFKDQKPRVKSETRNPKYSHGLLPFRVAQIYKEMVTFAKKKDVASFIAAAGIMAHYVGDAGQPLHISYLHHGDPTDTVLAPDAKSTDHVAKNLVSRQNAVHGSYESDMFKYHAVEMQTGLMKEVRKGSLPLIKANAHRASNRIAADKVVELMLKTFDILPPKQIVDRFKKVSPNQKPKPIANALWQSFGNQTIAVMANSCRYLAMLWESAWKEGGGTRAAARTGLVPKNELVKLYSNRSFLESCTLSDIIAKRKW
jgi:hypothetical protein